MRNMGAYSSTAAMTAIRNVKNTRFAAASLPGLSRFTPVSVSSDQLLCLPLPFTPANGFSCSRHVSPCRSAMRRMDSMMIWL